MNIREVLYGHRQLNMRRGITLHEIDILLSHVLRRPKEFLYAHPEYTLSTSQLKQMRHDIKRRVAGEPIAYITGHKEFYGLDFVVNKQVLIPRPDTELLVEKVLEHLNRRDIPWHVSTAKPIIADIGTGSGNIAVTIKKYLPACTLLATDISTSALAIAKRNAKRHQTPIHFFRGNVLSAVPARYMGELDCIIFNAPYLSKTEARKKNLAHEPQVALTPPGKPTELVAKLFEQAPKFLAANGAIFLEIGHRQARQVATLCKKYLPQMRAKTYKDLGNFDRVVRFTNR